MIIHSSKSLKSYGAITNEMAPERVETIKRENSSENSHKKKNKKTTSAIIEEVVIEQKNNNEENIKRCTSQR